MKYKEATMALTVENDCPCGSAHVIYHEDGETNSSYVSEFKHIEAGHKVFDEMQQRLVLQNVPSMVPINCLLSSYYSVKGVVEADFVEPMKHMSSAMSNGI